MTTTHQPRLSPEQIAQYNTQGYTLYRNPVFSPAKFEALRSHFETLVANLPPGFRPENLDVPHFADVKLFDWLLDDEVLDLVEGVIGPDIALWSSHFICKPRGDGKRVPWHEDSSYWRGSLDPIRVCTVWLAIDPSTRVNGCMKVIPGTQTGGFSEYENVADPEKHVFPTEIKRHQFDENKAVLIELQPNEASLHDGRLMHASEPNTSNIRRCGYTMRYMSTAVKFNQENFSQHKIYLARGRDLAGNSYGDPTKLEMDLAYFRSKNNRGGH
ncbi:MAG: phytanoyl-CoA dioxygenase family protein [Verrucomicrobiae bacterium]|nr:phytanoyl-CoA dioxygenase family protein [Verrucomicrobiae bacterium]